MKIRTWIKYEESYIPKGCRKFRYRECEDHVNITLAELETIVKRLKYAIDGQY